MPVKVEPGSEPIPGYKLIERLGGGGFGEVWKAEAPGGLLKAMKFVYGELGTSASAMDNDDENSRAEQEKRSLKRITAIRHSYILSVERIDEIQDQLVITTELADRTTWDRFRECRNQGLPGIPREELLGYMQETAEALDFMYDEYQLQHLDVKPQNLFLVHKHIKVADFGLVKTLGARGAATITGGVTPVYAAPETFDGWLSRFSDQYSLGIVYQELLTGQRPFAGSTMRQLILQHLQGEPDLTPLPANDKPSIARALSKNPDERFPNCMDLVRALRAAVSYPGTDVPSPRPAVPHDKEKKQDTADTSKTYDATEETQGARGKRKDPPPPTPDQPVPEAPAEENLADRPAPFPLRSDLRPPGSDAETPTTGSQMVTGMMRMAQGLRIDHTGGMAQAEFGTGLVQPALVLGLGTLGLESLQELRRLLTDEVAAPGDLPQIRLLGIDTDVDAIQRVSQGEPERNLNGQETLLARMHRPGHYLKPREGKLSSDSWLNPKVLYRIPRHQNGVGLRPLGRLAFMDHVRAIYRRLETELGRCNDAAAPATPLQESDLGIRSATPRVYVVTCLSGNTGSGMFIDVAYLVRHLLRKQGFPYAEVIGVFLVPPGAQQSIRSPDLANTYAALKELAHFTTGQAPFLARLDHPDPTRPPLVFREATPPFQRAYLVNLPEKAFGTENALKGALNQIGHFLYRELTTPLGKANDSLRPGRLDPSQPVGRLCFHAFGLFRIFCPRRRLIANAAVGLCKRLVQRWMDKKLSVPLNNLANLVQEQWDAKGLRPENLISQHQEACERVLELPPEQMLQAALGNLAKRPPLSGSANANLNVGQIVQAMDALEKLVGVPEESRPQGSSNFEPGLIETTLADVTAKIGDMVEQKLAEFVVSLIEEPAYRLAGAEEALRQLSDIVERSLRAQEQLCKELQDRAVSIYGHIHSVLEKPSSTAQQGSSSWRVSFGRKATPTQPDQAAELLEMLTSYPKCRYQSLILQHVNRLYVSLRGHVSDQIREVGFCRQRLLELSQMLDADATRDKEREHFAHEKALLPGGVSHLEEAVRQNLGAVTPADLQAFDGAVQQLIQKDFRALVQICMGPGQVLRTLTPALLRQAERFLGDRIKLQSVGEMFLERAKDVDEELAAAFEKAAPRVDRALLKSEFSVAVLPPDAQTHKLGPALRETLPKTERVDSNREDEIVFYREVPNLPDSAVEQLGPIAQEAYRQRLALDAPSLHTREDVPDWLVSVPKS